jgi:mono/diheme cytochrome c family protein
MISLVVIGMSLALGCAQNPVETEYRTTMLALPEGEAEAGREAFVSLGCAACHKVASDEELPTSDAGALGPELGLEVAKLGPGGLATSIVAPSHKVPAKYQGLTEGGASPMRDYTREMTIRQLADLVAYLERQGLKSQTRSGQAAPG